MFPSNTILIDGAGVVVEVQQCATTGFFIAVGNQPSAIEACLLDTTGLVGVFYHNGDSALPSIGDTIYTNSDGTVVFMPAITSWATAQLVSGTNNLAILINTNGVVTNAVSCP